MEILLEGTNRKLLHQHAFLEYKANIAADKNRWKAYKRYSDLAERKLHRIARNLGINISSLTIAPNMQHDGLVIKNIEED